MKIIVIVLLTLWASCASEPSEISSDKNPPYENQFAAIDDSTREVIRQRIEAHIQSYADQDLFSGAVLVAKGGTILYQGGFGFADYAQKEANTADTWFLIGSTTKSFTATALLRLRDKGLVDLETTLNNYLPLFNRDLADQLTLDNLLRMTSGLPNHLERLTEIRNEPVSTAQILEIIGTAELEYNPGSSYSYSNLNYHLIAAVMEEVTELSYEQILNREIFGPLNMQNSGTGRFDESIADKALGHHVSSWLPTEINNLSYALGSGSMYSTVGDIYKWDQALYKNSFLSEQSKKLAFTGGTEAFGYYGYGFRIRDYERPDSLDPHGTLVRHGGMMKGYLANVHRYLDDQCTVIILGNISMFPIRDLTTELKDIALGST